MEFSYIINYIAFGEIKPNPNYLLVQPVKSSDGIDRWTTVVEKITYKVEDNQILVPIRDAGMFRNWVKPKQQPLSVDKTLAVPKEITND